jgi:hypothetical protein
MWWERVGRTHHVQFRFLEHVGVFEQLRVLGSVWEVRIVGVHRLPELSLPARGDIAELPTWKRCSTRFGRLPG